MARWAPLNRIAFAAALALAACEENVPAEIAPEPAPIAEAPPTDGNTGTRPGIPRDGDDEREGRGERDGEGRGERDGRGDDGEARQPGRQPPGEGRGPAQPGARNPQARKPGARPGQPGQPKPIPPKPDGIEQVSSTKWTVSRSLADQWMKNPYALANVREAGEGWQLVGVRVKAAHWLGMRSGDVIMEANGHKLDTRPQLLAAYLDLKNDKVFRVTFVRGGQTMVHTYQIVDGGGGGGKKPANQ